MADKTARRAALIGKRVSALAVMYLTHRRDVTVEELPEDRGPDLMVRFTPEDKEGDRQFGVELRGAWPSATKDQADDILQPAVRKVQEYGPFAFPVCLFLFTMEENQAWYTWVAEPLVRAGKALLQMHTAADCKPLDADAVNDIVTQVDRWYDAFYANLVATADGGKPSRKRRKE